LLKDGKAWWGILIADQNQEHLGWVYIVNKYYKDPLYKRYKWWIVISILILGLGLRLYRLGDNLFWFDEVGVAVAAEQPSLPEALAVSQSYIMSMPLDYAIAWGVARLSQSERILRLPSAIWGTLTLLAVYFLYQEITNEYTALLGMFLLALTPIHIRYSQELKFYAPLVFFYVVASYFALISVRKKQSLLWGAFLIITMTGILFHVYTALVLVNLTLWVVFTSNKTILDQRLWKSFTFSTCFISIFTAMAILLFGKSPSYQSDLFAFESPIQIFLGGLGGIPIFPSTGSGFIFGGLCMVFAIVGLAITLSKNSDRFRFAIPISILLQVLLIISGDIVKKYFAVSRQLLMLVPFMILLTAIGVEGIVKHFTESTKRQPRSRSISLFLALIIFSIAATPVLSQYYQTKRVDTLAVVNWLSDHWKNNQTIYIHPGYESFTYSYYLGKWGSTKDNRGQLMKITESLFPLNLNSCQDNLPDANYLITNIVNDQQASCLKSEGFNPTYISPSNVAQPQIIWHNTKNPD
jgi:4-amino-4-deoxy-L-arabinose transferase-like glycosyltransferase